MNEKIVVSAEGYDRVDGRNAYRSHIKRITLGAPVLEENQSTNTRENLIFSGELIPEGVSVGIISNGFHICRALHLARTLGYENVSGIPARSDLATQPTNLLREFFAVVKDFWLVR